MNKTIEINPALFASGGTSKIKTAKNKSLKNKPILNPSVLKNKFLKRIKQHKSNEIKDTHKTNLKPTSIADNEFTDEFSQSIDYLQQLSREKKQNMDNQHKKEHLEKKTVKNYNSIYNASPNVNQMNINVELPSELKEERFHNPSYIPIHNHIPIHTPIHVPVHNPVIPIYKPLLNKPSITNEVPYGILKGGNKPTYRTWNKTQKHYTNITPTNITPTNITPTNITLKQDQLTTLKNTIAAKHAALTKDDWTTSQFIKKPINATTGHNATGHNAMGHNATGHNATMDHNASDPNTHILGHEKHKTTKKQITKRYTLGKSKIKRQIGVLIKNRETRKKVILAHRDLKHQPISEIKTYLNEHNLIKIGSKAPPDVIRKLYETSKLTGDIFNLNNDTLLHNLLKSDTYN
jgi:hypothetical protein